MKNVLFLVLLFASLLISSLAQKANPLFVVIVDDKRGFIDETGKIVIEPQFAGANDFSGGRAVIATYVNGKYKEGYIDDTGKIAIEPKFDEATDFNEGIALVGIGTFGLHGSGDHKFGFINKDGSWLIEPKYRKAWGFFEGLAAVMNDEGKWGFIDTTGKVIIPFQFGFGSMFTEALAPVFVNDKYGFIDKSGATVIKPQFTDVSAFSEGLAVAKIGGVLMKPYGTTITKRGEYFGKFVYIDKTGKIVIEPKADRAHSFSEGFARIESKGKHNFIDKNGKVVFKLKLYDAEDFSDGLAQVSLKNGLHFIDKQGNIVFKSPFWYVKDFRDGLAWVQEGNYSDKTVKYGYIDKTGRIIWKPSI